MAETATSTTIHQAVQAHKQVEKISESALESVAAQYMPYLREVQRNLWITVGTFVVGATLGFFFYQQILSFAMKRVNLIGINLVLTSPTQFIDLALQTGLIMGVLAALPYLTYSILKFVLPAMRAKERRVVLSLLPFALALAIVGFGFGVWIEQFVVTLYAQTTSSFQISNYWDVGNFFEQFMIMGLCMALVFQLPIILTVLLKMKIVQRKTLTKHRRYVYAAIVLFAVILPPTDLLSLTLIVLPLVFLFESALLLNR